MQLATVHSDTGTYLPKAKRGVRQRTPCRTHHPGYRYVWPTSVTANLGDRYVPVTAYCTVTAYCSTRTHRFASSM